MKPIVLPKIIQNIYIQSSNIENKMNLIPIFALIFIAVIVSMFYLGWKIKNIFTAKNIRINNFIFWSIYSILMILIVYMHSMFIVVIMYSVILYVIIDIISMIFNFSRRKSKKSKHKRVIGFSKKVYQDGLTVLGIGVLLTIYAVYNAGHVVVKQYDVSIDKKINDKNTLNIVTIYDLHLGTTVQKKGLDDMVKRTNSLKPDIIVLGGDTFDESTPELLKAQAFEAFKNFNSTYGVYYITGNHDRLSDNLRKSFNESGIVTLEDRYVLIDNSIYIVGRNDARNGARKKLSDIMQGIDSNNTIILLDHQPLDIPEAEKQGVDLQLSGHTHAGQLYPFNYIVGLVYDIGYGYMKKGNYNIIVSAGYGVWGFPVRIGSHSELVDVKVTGG